MVSSPPTQRENILLEEDEKVKAFVRRKYQPENYLVKHDNPLAVGPYDTCPYYMEHKMQQAVAMKMRKKAVLAVAADFEKTFGRHYGFFEGYRMEDAEAAIVLMGGTAGTARACVDPDACRGEKWGLMIQATDFPSLPGRRSWPSNAGPSCQTVEVMDKSAKTFPAPAAQFTRGQRRPDLGNRPEAHQCGIWSGRQETAP